MSSLATGCASGGPPLVSSVNSSLGLLRLADENRLEDPVGKGRYLREAGQRVDKHHMARVGNPNGSRSLRSRSVVLVSRVLGVFLILFGISATLGRVSADSPSPAK
jgi:hypothetical protein